MTIKIYHSNEFRDTSGYGHDFCTQEHVREFFENGKYEFVGTVDTDDLDKAYHLTNHIQHNWTKNEDVDAPSEKVRSSSVGDIFQIDDKYFVVGGCGFDEIELGGNPCH